MSEEKPSPQSGELLARVRTMVEALREPPSSLVEPGVEERITRVMQSSESAAALASQAGGAFLHLPPTAEQGDERPAAELLTEAAQESWEREREQLRASILALQQERDDLRQRIRDLEDRLAAERAENASSNPEIPPAQVEPVVAFDAYDPSGHKKRMGDILVEAGILSSEKLQSILAEQAVNKHTRIGRLLVERGITSEEMIAKVLAAQLKLPFVDLHPEDIVPAAALQVSAELARRHECIPIDGDLGRITLAMANPMDLLAIDNIELACNRRVSPVVAVPSAIAAAITHIYGGGTRQ